MSDTLSVSRSRDNAASETLDAVVVGAGFAGLYMLYRLREMGLRTRVFEAGTGVGGTWFWNRYPGARCDVDSLEYSYSFSEDLQQEWSWSERFATQPEILRYIDHVADRFDLRRDIQLETRVTAAHFDEGHDTWTVTTDRGDTVVARYCIMATGCLSAARAPAIPGMETFRGPTYHTGEWPHEGVDLSGLRVGLIGTGSSGIQTTPRVAAEAAHLTVFQRSPNFSVPARNAPTDRERETEWRARYAELRARARETSAGILYDYNDTTALSVDDERRKVEFEARWAKGGVNFMRTFADIMLDRDANHTAAEFVRGKIRETVKDPDVAARLMPSDHPIGTKRICVDDGYYETFNRDNVTLVDIRANPIDAITPDGLTAGGVDYAFDALILATGFDAITGALAKIDIRGTGGRALVDSWGAGPRTYLGLMSAGYPNLFMITGPGSPSTLANMVVAIEQHVDWIAACLEHLRANGLQRIEAEDDAQDAWVQHVNEVAHRTLFVLANSWYMGANIPGKPRLFMPYVGGFGVYRRKCLDNAEAGYPGFRLSGQVRTQARSERAA